MRDARFHASPEIDFADFLLRVWSIVRNSSVNKNFVCYSADSDLELFRKDGYSRTGSF